MTDKEIQQLTDRYLEGLTSPDEELLLARELQRPDISEEWQAVRLMLGELALGEAEYDAMMDRRKPSVHRRLAPRRRWWWVAAAACIVALLSLHTIYNKKEQAAERPVVAQQQTVHRDTLVKIEEKVPTPTVAEKKPVVVKPSPRPTPTTATGDLAACIARLEAEMANIDDSVSAAHLEKLIAADARLQQLVYRIIGKQTEQALNELQKDSTANYINF